MTQDAHPTPAATRGPSIDPRTAPVVTIIAVGFALYAGRDFFVPLSFAVLLGFLLNPIVTWFAKRHVPRWLGALLALGLVIAVVTGVVAALQEPASRWLGRLPVIERVLLERIAPITDSLKDIQARTEAMETIVEETMPSEGTPVRIASNTWRENVLADLAEGLYFLAAAFILTYFLLVGGPRLTEQFRRLRWHGFRQRRLLCAVKASEQVVSRYLANLLAINVVTGLLAGIIFWLLDVPTPELWAVVIAILRFIPYLGVWLSAALVTLAAIAGDAHWPALLYPGLAYLALTFVIGAFVDPWVHSLRFSINPIAVFLAVLFMGSLWGVPGLLVAVPLLVISTIACHYSRRWRGVARLLQQ